MVCGEEVWALLLEGAPGADPEAGLRLEDAPEATPAAALGPVWDVGREAAALGAPAEALAPAPVGAVAAALGLAAEVSTFSGSLGARAATCMTDIYKVWQLLFSSTLAQIK